MTIRFDSQRAIDLSTSNPNGVFARFGYIGPHPSRPCDTCQAEEFLSGDWNMGYRCPNGHRFGTQDEWDWEAGRYRP